MASGILANSIPLPDFAKLHRVYGPGSRVSGFIGPVRRKLSANVEKRGLCRLAGLPYVEVHGTY